MKERESRGGGGRAGEEEGEQEWELTDTEQYSGESVNSLCIPSPPTELVGHTTVALSTCTEPPHTSHHAASAPYSQYPIQPVLHTASTPYTQYSIQPVPPYTQYSIQPVPHTASTPYTQ